MKNGKLTVAQIGCGAFAESMDLPNFGKHPNTEVTWCCDISPERARAMADKFGARNATGDFHDVVDDPEVDLIKIATTHEAHLPIIEAAAAKGKHVLCEKPMAMEETEALRIIRAVRRNGVKLCVDLNRRMAPALVALREAWRDHCRAPKHQPWRFIEVDRDPFPEETQTQLLIRIQDESATYRLQHLDPLRGGGQVLGESVHWLDLACWFFAPQVPVEILAWGSSRFSHGIHLRFSGGDTATITFSCSGTFDYPKELYEVAAHGALFRSEHFVENTYYGIPGKDREVFALKRDPLPEIGAEGGLAGLMKKYRATVEGMKGSSKAIHGSLAVEKGHAGLLNDFVQAILHDRPNPCDEMAGYLSVHLANQAIRSIELRQALPIALERLFPCIV